MRWRVPTTTADVTRLQRSNREVVTLAKRALTQFWESLDVSRPEQARDALLAFMPVLVEQFGQAAATVAADWYDGIRLRDVGGRFDALLVDPPAAEQVQGTVRYQAGRLFTDQPEIALATLQGSLQRFVANTSRHTLQYNAYRDRARPKYARVPTGSKTCAFCSLLASRGFVYASQRSAKFASDGDKYHDDCDCAAVISFAEDPVLDDYDPGSLYSAYQAARNASGSSSLNEIAAEMRRQDPDRYTDGVHDH